MKKHIKKIVTCGLIGISLSFGAIHVANADTGVMQRLENLVTRMEKASANMPTHFKKSTLVDIKEVKMVKGEYSGKDIIGKITNNTGADLDSVTLEYEILDKNGNTLKYNTDVYTQKIKNGGTIEFKGRVLEDEKATSFKLKSVGTKVDNIN